MSMSILNFPWHIPLASVTYKGLGSAVRAHVREFSTVVMVSAGMTSSSRSGLFFPHRPKGRATLS